MVKTIGTMTTNGAVLLGASLGLSMETTLNKTGTVKKPDRKKLDKQILEAMQTLLNAAFLTTPSLVFNGGRACTASPVPINVTWLWISMFTRGPWQR